MWPERVRSHDDLPQQGAVRREPDAAAGQPPQRCHRPAATMRALVVWLSNCSPVKPAAPSEGGEIMDFMYGLLISDFFVFLK